MCDKLSGQTRIDWEERNAYSAHRSMFIKFDFIVCMVLLIQLPLRLQFLHINCANQSLQIHTTIERLTKKRHTRNTQNIPKTIYIPNWRNVHREREKKVSKTNASVRCARARSRSHTPTRMRKFNKNALASAIIYWPIVPLVHAFDRNDEAHLFWFLHNINFTGHGAFTRIGSLLLWASSVIGVDWREVICALVSL